MHAETAPPLHRKGDETPEWWFKQIDMAQCVARDAWGKPQHYRRQLHDLYNLEVGEVVIGIEDDGKEGGRRYDFPAVEQADLLYLPRHKEWTRSQAFDRQPEVRFNRTGPKDNILGEMLETLCERVGDEAGELDAWRPTIDDSLAYGSFVVWYGVGSNVADAQSLLRASVSAKEAVMMAEQLIDDPDGVEYRAFRGQDHKRIAEAMRKKAYDPEILLQPRGAIVQDALVAAAGLHDIEAEKEARAPRERRVERNEAWVQRSPVGTGTLWSHDVDDFYDARCVFRRLVLDIDVAREHPGWRPSVAKRLQPGAFNMDDGWRGDPAGSEGEDANKILTNKVVVWEVWDRKYHEIHYIARGVDGFLERYKVDPNDGVVKGFVPCVYCAPLKSTKASPQRPYGVPVAAIAYPIQRAIIKMATYHIEAVKKMGVRHTQSFGPLGDQEDAIVAGITGTNIEVPSEFREMFARGADYIRQINYGTMPTEFFQTLETWVVKLAHMLAWPLSQLTGAPQSRTATGETVALQGGSSQMGDFVREVQDAFGRGQAIKLALIKRWYTDEQLRDLLPSRYFTPMSMGEDGQPGPSLFDLWKVSSTEGDDVTATFSPGEGDVIRRNQLREYLEFLASLPGPAPGLPMFGTEALMPTIREMAKTFDGMDAPEPTKYTPEQIEEARELAMSQSQRGGQNKGEGRTKRSSSTSTGERPSSGRVGAGANDAVR